jgi:hypothetical protein
MQIRVSKKEKKRKEKLAIKKRGDKGNAVKWQCSCLAWFDPQHSKRKDKNKRNSL